MTFTALVLPGAQGGTLTGTVLFTIDGSPEPIVPLQIIGNDGQATFSTSTLTAGKHTISATYQGDVTFAQSATSNPLVQTVNAAVVGGNAVLPDPPTVVSVKRYGIHMQPTVLVLTFSEGLDPVNAQDVSNYQILGPTGRSVGIASAVYDPALDTVTLKPRERINLHETYQLKVFGAESVV